MKTMLKNKCSLLVKGSLMLVVFLATVLVCTSCRDDDDEENIPPVPVSANSSCPDVNHPHMIDLGLPSHTKWSCCNVGATAPELAGSYYAWGETVEKDVYADANYIDYDKTTKQFITKTSDIAGEWNDAATANWGKPWRMPTRSQCQELIDKCTSEWVVENSVYGRKFTGSNGNSIFFPAAGWRDFSGLIGTSRGGYLSSTLESYQGVWGLYISKQWARMGGNWRSYGYTIRPVATPSNGVVEYTWF